MAEFDKDQLRKYWMIKGMVISILTVVGIPLMAIWVPIAWKFMGRWIERLSAELTPTKLVIRHGYFVRVEKIVPLEKITDLALRQGPIMRRLGLEAIAVETAGQSAGPGAALVQLVGINNTRAFRKAVLDQRDIVAAGSQPTPLQSDATPQSPSTPGGGSDRDILEKIHDTLTNIERKLDVQ